MVESHLFEAEAYPSLTLRGTGRRVTGIPRMGTDLLAERRVVTRRFYYYRRCMDIATELMINEEIRDREVRLIDENGEQRERRAARSHAHAAGAAAGGGERL